jgi:hypothetical protein
MLRRPKHSKIEVLALKEEEEEEGEEEGGGEEEEEEEGCYVTCPFYCFKLCRNKKKDGHNLLEVCHTECHMNLLCTFDLRNVRTDRRT